MIVAGRVLDQDDRRRVICKWTIDLDVDPPVLTVYLPGQGTRIVSRQSIDELVLRQLYFQQLVPAGS